MKINISNYIRDNKNIIGNALLTAFTFWSDRNPKEKLEDSPFYSEDGILEVQLLVNGKEIPFDVILNKYAEAYHAMIDCRAKEILKEKCNNIQECLSELEKSIKDRANVLFPGEDQYL